MSSILGSEKFIKWVKGRFPKKKKEKEIPESSAYSDEFGHLFRGIPATCSEDNRPSVPRQIGHLVGAKRRWYFVTSQSLFC